MCLQMGFPGGSAGEESTCNAGDHSLIPGLGRSPGKGNSYPLQYAGLENSRDCVSPWGRKESDMTELLSLSYLVGQTTQGTQDRPGKLARRQGISLT